MSTTISTFPLTATTLVEGMGGFTIPLTVTLTSSDVTRLIELSANGGVSYYPAQLDTSTDTDIIVTISTPITNVRVTGAIGDTLSMVNHIGTIASIDELARSSDTIAGISIAAWGDSLTFGSGSIKPFPALLGVSTGYHVLNGGIAGDTSTQIKTRMLAAGTSKLALPTIIWAGRNNYTDPTTIKADIASMVAALTTPNYLILGIFNDSSQVSGSGGWTTITTLNDDLALLYGSRFIDIRAYIISQYDPGTPQDVTDHTNDILPSTLRSDTLHLNLAGYTKVVERIIQSIALLVPVQNTNYLTVDSYKFINKEHDSNGYWQNGDRVLFSDQTLSNLAVGFHSLLSNTTGANNIGVGKDAARSNTTGSFNTAFGDSAAYNLTTGSNTAAFGFGAGYGNISGTSCTFIGYNAGRYQADGVTALSTPLTSVYIGANTRGFSNSDVNSTVIGNNAIGRGANTVTIGASTVTSTALQGLLCQTSKEVVATAALTAATITKAHTYFTGTAGASFAVTLPAASATIDGAKVTIMSVNERITTTWISTGATGGFIGAPATLLALTPYVLQYDHASLAWYISK